MTTPIQDIPVKRIDGSPTSLAEFKNQVVLVVNVASKCGLTKQYAGLESLYETYRDRGLVIAGFPSDDFGHQEPGSNDEIQEFCQTTFGVKFPLFEKASVTGSAKQALYAALIDAQPVAVSTSATPFRDKLAGYGMTPNPEPEILWNFEKFLIARDGTVVKRFSPDTTPEDVALVDAITNELAKSN